MSAIVAVKMSVLNTLLQYIIIIYSLYCQHNTNKKIKKKNTENDLKGITQKTKND